MCDFTSQNKPCFMSAFMQLVFVMILFKNQFLFTGMAVYAVCFSHWAQNNPGNANPGVIWKWRQILAGKLISCVVRNNFKSPPPESLKVQAMTDHSGGWAESPLICHFNNMVVHNGKQWFNEMLVCQYRKLLTQIRWIWVLFVIRIMYFPLS